MQPMAPVTKKCIVSLLTMSYTQSLHPSKRLAIRCHPDDNASYGRGGPLNKDATLGNGNVAAERCPQNRQSGCDMMLWMSHIVRGCVRHLGGIA